ncbi:hypothetical protein K435DRAFT_866667 [Dendrothele bispora CBS 962.96]|uniref:Uncharacterized protein n=1 Tax=Dendrothele bispora (strain CBS 962.96) TaxID=1314807 RepID=A0A4S8LG93_DENBC|nr:hypothetical protein K435DRAFT_866667 [Dendrothele bispora CBS 962.96]
MYATWNSHPQPTNLCSPSGSRVSLDPLPAYDGAETSIASTQSISMYPCTSLNMTHAISQDIPAIHKDGNLFAHSSAARPHILVNNKPLQRLKLDNEMLEPAWLTMMLGSDSPFSGDSDFNWQHMSWRMISGNIRAS